MTNLLLTLVTFLPLLGAAIIFVFIRGEEAEVARNSRQMALWTSLVTFLLSLFVWFDFERGSGAFQMVEKYDWIPSLGISAENVASL